ncbi:MAG: UbiH/UbiF/VisC/COQ6 family ubiquinone biosynthesis hydroxylase [Gammaproteobacteria bacterium]|nr:UbiH/UbiF/VisC/COQ6 family ubiquinone biosynthesis hydroxylase [Gammaproteobacteria bacterium]
MNNKFDVIVVGGGMVGATLAAALGRSKLSIAVIEASEPLPFQPDQPYDLRVSAVSIGSQRMFEAVGAWQAMLDKRACPYRRMLVWDGEGGGETLFDSGDIYQPVLGNIIENRIIQLSLLEVVKGMDNIHWLCPESVESIAETSSGISLELASGKTLSAKLLVGADGANSAVRRLSDIAVDKQPYHQHALVATIETELPQQDITWQRFVPSGPQAFLPLKGNRASMVWYNSEDEVKRLKALDNETFRQEMLATFPERLGGINSIIERGSFPLIKSHAETYVKNRVVLIGDASHTIHPLAGQGVNLGLMDAAALVDIVLPLQAAGKDFGTLKVLRKYQRARRGYNTLMISAMDVFHHAFKERPLPVRLLRSAALDFADKVGPVRNLAMKYAMGLAGDLPSLARGKLPV